MSRVVGHSPAEAGRTGVSPASSQMVEADQPKASRRRNAPLPPQACVSYLSGMSSGGHAGTTEQIQARICKPLLVIVRPSNSDLLFLSVDPLAYDPLMLNGPHPKLAFVASLLWIRLEVLPSPIRRDLEVAYRDERNRQKRKDCLGLILCACRIARLFRCRRMPTQQREQQRVHPRAINVDLGVVEADLQAIGGFIHVLVGIRFGESPAARPHSP